MELCANVMDDSCLARTNERVVIRPLGRVRTILSHFRHCALMMAALAHNALVAETVVALSGALKICQRVTLVQEYRAFFVIKTCVCGVDIVSCRATVVPWTYDVT